MGTQKKSISKEKDPVGSKSVSVGPTAIAMGPISKSDPLYMKKGSIVQPWNIPIGRKSDSGSDMRNRKKAICDYGTKNDSGKLRMDLLPPDVEAAWAEVLTKGAEKYEPRNWELGINFSRVYAAARRHLKDFWAGDDYDEETGLLHLAHALCCISFLLAYQLRHLDSFDDRPKLIKENNVTKEPTDSSS